MQYRYHAKTYEDLQKAVDAYCREQGSCSDCPMAIFKCANVAEVATDEKAYTELLYTSGIREVVASN